MVATDGNSRTTAACAGKEVKDSQGKVTGGTGSLNDGLRVAFKAGSVMGFVVVGLGLVGCAGCFCILAMHQGLGKTESLQILAGFGRSGRRRSRCSRELRAASTRRPRTSVPTSSAKSRPVLMKTTRTTRPSSRTTSETMWATSRAWALIYLNRMSVPSLLP